MNEKKKVRKELYKRYRPRNFDGVLGQKTTAMASLRAMAEDGKLPHAILLTGPSGCGKTTIARILKDYLECADQDFCEINAADFRGVDTIREIRQVVGLSPLQGGGARIWLIDEAHKLTSDAQAALLKILEDTPDLSYFILATTDPHKLSKTIHTRCTEVKLTSLTPDELRQVIQRVLIREKTEVAKEVIDEIVEAADGSARKALVILEQALGMKETKDQLNVVRGTNFNREKAIDLARAIFNGQTWPSWGVVSAVLKTIEDTDDPEGVRYMVLGYARKVMLGGGPMAARAFAVVDIFSRNFYDSKHAGLAAACWRVVHKM